MGLGPPSVWNHGVPLPRHLDRCLHSHEDFAIQVDNHQRGCLPQTSPHIRSCPPQTGTAVEDRRLVHSRGVSGWGSYPSPGQSQKMNLSTNSIPPSSTYSAPPSIRSTTYLPQIPRKARPSSMGKSRKKSLKVGRSIIQHGLSETLKKKPLFSFFYLKPFWGEKFIVEYHSR